MPKIVDHKKYKKELLEKCFYLFSQKGYSNVSMRDIAKELNVSTGTLYYYFETKEKILEQLLIFVSQQNVDDYINQVKQIKHIEDKINAMIQFLINNKKYYQNIMLLAFDYFRNNKQTSIKLKSSEQLFTQFTELYVKRFSDTLQLPKETCQTLFTFILGAISHSLLTPNEMDFEKEVQNIKNILFALK